jgi:uncharacterized protein (TIGR00299 family) protein
MAERVVLYIDPWMGVAGDMLMAALLDTDRGGSHLEPILRRTLAAMGLDPAIVSVLREVDQGIECLAVRVREEDNAPLRHLSDLVKILDDSVLPPRVRERSRSAFERLARVEASIHGCSADEIHFHEVGAVDTLVDVVGVFALVEALGIERVGVGTIPVGGGTVNIAHGQMRVPAPATASLLTGYPVTGGPEMRELTTPTGALLVSELKAEAGAIPAMFVDRIGYGCGTMKFHSGPNVLRVLVGRACGESAGETEGGEDVVVELESNLDNVSAEVIGHTCRLLREAGALEVWTAPVFMKKDRPGCVFHALVLPGAEAALSNIIIAETGTLGVRRQSKRRTVADRGMVTVAVEGTEVAVKWGRHQGRITSVTPEYDSAVAAAEAIGLPLKELMSRAGEEARKLLQAEHMVTR